MKSALFMSLTSLMVGAVAVARGGDNVLVGPARTIEGQEIQLEEFAGKVVLVVNVASRCGFTRQYRDLQALYEKYRDKGLVVLGFPCNQFGGQEPGSEAEIKAFCESRFGVTFPLFAKVDVNGENAHPLFRRPTAADAPFDDRGPVKWNFEKFLIGRDGVPIARFRSRVAPDAPEVIAAIEKALESR